MNQLHHQLQKAPTTTLPINHPQNNASNLKRSRIPAMAGTIQSNIKTIRQLGCRSNDNEMERNHRKAIIEVASQHLQSTSILGNNRRNQGQYFKTKCKVSGPNPAPQCILTSESRQQSRNHPTNQQKQSPMFGSNDSINTASTTGIPRINQNSRSKPQNMQPQLHYKHTRNGVMQNSSGGNTSASSNNTKLNFAKLKSSAHNIIGAQQTNGILSGGPIPCPPVNLHFQFDPKKENLEMLHLSKERKDKQFNQQVENNSVVRSTVNATQMHLRSMLQENQNSNNLNIRRAFGSNDSQANCAPHQHRYQNPQLKFSAYGAGANTVAQANPFQQQCRSSIKLRDFKISSVMVSQPRQYENHHQNITNTTYVNSSAANSMTQPHSFDEKQICGSGNPSKDDGVRCRNHKNSGSISYQNQLNAGQSQTAEASVQRQQSTSVNQNVNNKSVISTNGTGSENVSTICQGDIQQRQINNSFIQHQLSQQLQNILPIQKDSYPQIPQISKQNVKAQITKRIDLAGFQIMDQNLRNEYQFDQKAQSVTQTVSTIQTENQGIQNKSAINHMIIQNEGLINAVHLKHNNQKLVQKTTSGGIFLGHMGLGHKSNRSSSTNSNESANLIHCKSRDSCSRLEIQINDARLLNQQSQNQIRQICQNQKLSKPNTNLPVPASSLDIQKEDLKAQINYKQPDYKNSHRAHFNGADYGLGSEQLKNGNIEQIQDFCSYTSDSYSEFSVKHPQQYNIPQPQQIKSNTRLLNQNVNQQRTDQQANKEIISGVSNQQFDNKSINYLQQIQLQNRQLQVNHQLIINKKDKALSKQIAVDEITQDNQIIMQSKQRDGMAAPAPASQAHPERRQSLMNDAQQVTMASIKTSKSSKLIVTANSQNRDLTVANSRSQQFVPAKAKGLLSGPQAHAALLSNQRANACSRQQIKSEEAQASSMKNRECVASRKTTRIMAPSQNTASDVNQKSSQVRQIKSLSNIGDRSEDNQHIQNNVNGGGTSSNMETVESEQMQQPLSVNFNFTNINSSDNQSNTKDNLPNIRNVLDKQSQDGGFPGFNLQRVPTTSTFQLSKDTTHGAISQKRCVSQNIAAKTAKNINSVVQSSSVTGPQKEISVSVKPLITQKPQCNSDEKNLKIIEFRKNLKKQIDDGTHEAKRVFDLHGGQQKREILDNILRIHGQHPSQQKIGGEEPVPNPISGNEITKEYRTKMTDWMVEVCTSFKCSSRTYFLAVQIFDKYIMKCRQFGKVLQNKDVHSIGVTAMYLASKYEDIFPLHSKIVSDKIAHKAISSKEILKKEEEFLATFEYEMDFITHFDFHHTYVERLKQKLFQGQKSPSLKQNKTFFDLLQAQSLLLLKMAIQNNSFTSQSPSVLAVSALYASTGFLKNSKKYNQFETAKFCMQTRKIILELLEKDGKTAKEFKKNQRFRSQIAAKMETKKANKGSQEVQDYASRVLDTYARQFNQQNLERTSMRMVEFSKVFDDWHCGLNQLRKFNKVPIE